MISHRLAQAYESSISMFAIASFFSHILPNGMVDRAQNPQLIF